MSNLSAFRLPFVALLLFTSVFGSPVAGKQSFSRPDPLRRLRPYDGGFDIRNRHYWASAAFTGVHGYAIAGVWIVFGLGFGSYLIIKMCNGTLQPFLDHPSSYYLVLFALIAVFSSLAITFCSLIIAANQSSLHRSKNLMDTIFGAANGMQETIGTVVQVLTKIQKLLEPYEGQTSQALNQTVYRISNEKNSIHNFVEETRRTSDHAIETVYIMNLVFASINLGVLVAGCVLLFLHWHPGLIIIIFFCWILTTVSWILTGFDFFFHIFAGDACSAFEDFERNPQDGSLSSLLSSCSNSSTSDIFMAQLGYTVHKFIAESNSKISALAHKLIQKDDHSEDPFIVGIICDPFAHAPSYSYTPGNCAQDAIQIKDLPNILATLTCQDDDDVPTENCKAQGRFLPHSSYTKTMAYILSIEHVMASYPDLEALARCSALRHAISDVVMHQCKPFRTSVKLLWACILTLSIVMVILSLLWVTKAFQEKGKRFPLCSIVPRPRSD